QGPERQLGGGRPPRGAGAKARGGRVGLGPPAMLKQLDIAGPLIGFLIQSARVPSGGSVSLKGWAKPVAEPEIAVHIGRNVSAGADRAAAAAAVAGISPAIRLVHLQ